MTPIYALLLSLAATAGVTAGTVGSPSCQTVNATDNEAQSILAGLTEFYKKSNGIKLTFTGTLDGVLWLKAERFYLNSGGVESWFDGKSQWSYIKENEEVTISSPTPEELQSINPFIMLHAAQTEYTARYTGYTQVKGKQGKNLVLVPKKKGDIASLGIVVSENGKPLSLSVRLNNGETQEFLINTFLSSENIPDSAFCFPYAKYPHSEIIDMR